MSRGRDPRSSAAASGDAVQLDLFGAAMPVRVRDHPLWAVWIGMTMRCVNPKARSFKYYGGRGIVICEEWRGSSRPFIAWALSHGWQPGLQLDRRDNDGPYSPRNCRFATPSANNSNKRNTVRLADGRAAWPLARRAGVNRSTFGMRISLGWSPEQAAGLEPRPAMRSGAVSGATAPQRVAHRPTYQKPANAAPAASPALYGASAKPERKANG